MASDTVIKFKAVRYSVGGQVGYRPQLESQTIVKDGNFCTEVVGEAGMSMSSAELLHAMQTVGRVGPDLVARDGRPRGITGLLKFNRTAKGKLDSPNSPWNETCKAQIRPQIMNAATKFITDATFKNVNECVSPKITNILYEGCVEGTNVVKGNKKIIVYGQNVQFIFGLVGGGNDTATLTKGTTVRELTCVESDAGHCVFEWPDGLEVTTGAQATFEMNTRCGDPAGETFRTTRKVVCFAADPTVVTITKVESVLGENQVKSGQAVTIKGTHFAATDVIRMVYVDNAGDEIATAQAAPLQPDGSHRIASLTEPGSIDITKPVYFTVKTAGGDVAKSANCTYTIAE